MDGFIVLVFRFKAHLLLCKCNSVVVEHLLLSSKVLILLGSVHLVLFEGGRGSVSVCIPAQKISPDIVFESSF